MDTIHEYKKYKTVFINNPFKEKEEVYKLIEEYNSKINLSKKQNLAMENDLIKLIDYYFDNGYDINKIKKLIDPNKLGNFYDVDNSENDIWYPLDNAAKIYPISMQFNRMAIFRISMYLNMKIEPIVLQMALNFTIKRFPFYACVLNDGFFWNYLDTVPKRYKINSESNVPCKRMNVSTYGKQCFRVVYFENRLSVEFFHILTDGFGASVFLKTLVREYLLLMDKKIELSNDLKDISEYPLKQEWSNDFKKVKLVDKSSGFADTIAIQLNGKLSKYHPDHVVHFTFSAKEIKKICKKYDITLTICMLTLMFMSGKHKNKKKGTYKIQVPVNMRKYYQSITMRNFSLYCSIKLKYDEITDFESTSKLIKEQIAREASKESMEEVLTMANKLVNNLRFVPLVIKKPFAKIAYGLLGERVFSNTLSNLGLIEINEDMQKYVDKMDLVLNTSNTNRAGCSMVSVLDKVVFTISKQTENEEFELRMYENLKKYLKKVEVSGSLNG